MVAMSGGKNKEKLDLGQDFAKELAFLKDKILGPQKANKKVEEEKIAQTEKGEVTKETIEKYDEKLLAEYEKTSTKESYSGGGVPPKIKIKEIDYDDPNDGQDSYTLPQSSKESIKKRLEIFDEIEKLIQNGDPKQSWFVNLPLKISKLIMNLGK